MKPKQQNNLRLVVVQTQLLPNASALLINIAKGSISKGDAIYKFTKAIPVRETKAEKSPGKTLESYIAMLNN